MAGGDASCAGGVLELLIIQPTPFCNLDCGYCYLPGRQSKERISREVLRTIFQRAFESSLVGGEFTVVWHAGEPLVMPVSFYEEALGIIREENTQGVQVSHSFQTNATLVTREWCEFLLANELSIGVSVDGPAFLHDRHRKTRGGQGTWGRVARGIDLLNGHQVPFHVITVLTAESLDFPDELFDFYCDFGMRDVCFNIEEIEGPHTSSTLSPMAAQMRYRQFMERFYDLTQESGERFSVREFDSAAASVLATIPIREYRGPQQTTPFGIISVDCKGNFSTFSPELLGLQSEVYGDFALGNVMTDRFESVMETPKYQAIARDVALGVERCKRECEYFPYCGGGAPINKLFENGAFDSTETLFCRLTRKMPIDIVLEKVTRNAAPAHHC